MRILLASSEVYPYSKTGGLADAVGALGKALARAGHQVGIVTPLYRGIAYNSLSNQVYIISRTGPSDGLTINALDATTGEDLYQLNTSGISGGSIILLAMGVGEDGALYAANMDTSATTGATSRNAAYSSTIAISSFCRRLRGFTSCMMLPPMMQIIDG